MAINVSSRKPNCKARDRSHALNTHNRKQKLNLQVLRLAALSHRAVRGLYACTAKLSLTYYEKQTSAVRRVPRGSQKS